MTPFGNKRRMTGETKAERLSSRVLYVTAALTAIVFGCFYFIGYDIPFDDDPKFKSPMFTDAVLMLVFILIIATLSATVYAVVKEIKGHDKRNDNAENIPSRRIAAITAVSTCACMAVSFIAGSTRPMFINGTQYTTTFWLKASDMFILTTITLIIAAIAILVAARIKYVNRVKKDCRQ